MSVRAKFQLLEAKHHHQPVPDNVYVEFRFVAVNSATGKENESWSRYTPSGELKMAVTNPAAIEQFEIGKSYYLDITPAD